MAAVALFSLLAPWTRSGLLATRAMILATRAMISRSLGAVGLPNMGAANFLVSYTTLAHIRAPRRSTSLGLVLRVVWDIVRRHASTRCDYPVSAACGTMSSGDFTDTRAARRHRPARLFPTSAKSPHLPKEIFWRILSYWRTDRDP